MAFPPLKLLCMCVCVCVCVCALCTSPHDDLNNAFLRPFHVQIHPAVLTPALVFPQGEKGPRGPGVVVCADVYPIKIR